MFVLEGRTELRHRCRRDVSTVLEGKTVPSLRLCRHDMRTVLEGKTVLILPLLLLLLLLKRPALLEVVVIVRHLA